MEFNDETLNAGAAGGDDGSSREPGDERASVERPSAAGGEHTPAPSASAAGGESVRPADTPAASGAGEEPSAARDDTESGGGTDGRSASRPRPSTGAQRRAPAREPVGDDDDDGDDEGDDDDGDNGGGGGTTTSGAPRKRRRGRRGGKRHRRKPATAAAGGGAAGGGAAGGDGAGGDATGGTAATEPDAEADAAVGASEAAPPSRPPQRQRAPRSGSQQRTRTPRAPRAAAPRSGSGSGPAAAKGAAPGADTTEDADIEAAIMREETLTDEQGAAEDRADALAGMVGAEEAQPDADGGETPATGSAPAKKRRRRGGRGRGKKTAATGDSAATTEAKPEAKPAAKSAAKATRPAREPAAKKAASGGSTRMAARQQRRQQRPQRPRRRLSEEEARALRGEAKTMLIHASHGRTQIAVLEQRELIEHYVAREASHTMVGNIYLGRVQNVIAGMEAAFVDLGRGRNAVLYAGEVQYSAEDLEAEEVPRIEKVLKSGQPVLVQVTKDPIGTKGARLTSQVSLPGRYLVLAPEQRLTGISRRLHENERARLRQILRDIRPEGHGVIVRTAAEGASKDALKLDLDHLAKQWDEVKRKQKRAKAPALLYEEPELVMRVVRDIFSGDFERVVCDERTIYERLSGYLDETAPDLLDKLELHDASLPMLESFHVTEQIHKALERKVWLPSGGSIVIDRTEAMTVIDVNTGRFVGKGGSLEDTVFKNNLEAADEVARQLRLRDIGGIIVIDFIDMLNLHNRAEVLRTLKRALARDKTRSQVSDEVSKLGLVEMTRKRSSEGLLEAFSETCPQCEGRGIVITHEID